jgi:hypothetical protein
VFIARAGTPGAASRQAPYTVVWSREIEESGVRSLTVSADALITAGGPAPLEARSLATGGTLWTAETETEGTIAIDGTTLVAIVGTRVLGIASASGETLWSREMSGPLLGPDVRQGLAVVATGSVVHALHVADGTPAWETDLGAPVALAPVLSDAHVAVSLADKSVAAIDQRTGAIAWKASMDFAPMTLAMAGARVVVTTDNQLLCMFRMPGTRPSWCWPVGIPAAGAAVLDDQNVYVAYLDNTLRVFRVNDGAMRASPQLAARPALLRMRLGGGLVMVPLVTGTLAFVRPSDRFAVLKLSSPDEGLFPDLRGWSTSEDGSRIALLTVSPSGRKLTLLRRTDAPPGLATPPAKAAAPPSPATAP